MVDLLYRDRLVDRGRTTGDLVMEIVIGAVVVAVLVAITEIYFRMDDE